MPVNSGTTTRWRCLVNMRRKILKVPLVLVVLGLLMTSCAPQSETSDSTPPATASPGGAPISPAAAVPITLPVLDALFAGEAFRADLKSKLQLTDDQITSLRKISSEAVTKLHQSNAENQSGSAEAARQNAVDAIRGVIGPDKSEQLMALARERWNKGSEELETAAAARLAEPSMLPGPNAVPSDTRIVVNIPAFRMDIFQNGTLLKSYKIGIGYPQFPLPQGLRKAETIIFNPTWTPPDSPWVNTMKVTPGQVIAAGSAQNPLGPIKIPIGAPSLIHGGKPLSKIGTFASHGCVGLTNAEVKDFAKVLAQATSTGLTEASMAVYLKNRTRTRSLPLAQMVPVELRYETIVFEDGKLHIYRDVYDQNTNTEENLRAVFTASGTSFDNLNEEEKSQALAAVNTFSRHPKKLPTPTPTPTPANDAPQTAASKAAIALERKAEAERQKRLHSQKEIVIEIVELAGKGYPAPVNLDSGAGTQVSAAPIAVNKP
jgi:lipoprotein-anchoring transpeptidase ErfK/SrfK